MERLVTVADVAKRFGVHAETVRRWVREDMIPYYRPSSHTLRFDLRAVEEALNSPLQRASDAGWGEMD